MFLEEDLNIFVETEEFAELVDVDGVELPAQLMTISQERSKLVRNQFPHLKGDFTELFFRAGDYTAIKKRLPRVHEWVYVNGKRFDVISLENEPGICHLVLVSYRQSVPR